MRFHRHASYMDCSLAQAVGDGSRGGSMMQCYSLSLMEAVAAGFNGSLVSMNRGAQSPQLYPAPLSLSLSFSLSLVHYLCLVLSFLPCHLQSTIWSISGFPTHPTHKQPHPRPPPIFLLTSPARNHLITVHTSSLKHTNTQYLTSHAPTTQTSFTRYTQHIQSLLSSYFKWQAFGTGNY